MKKYKNMYDVIVTRRTVRKFSQKAIPYRILKKLVNAARLAPSAANLQFCEYLVVDKKDLVSQIFPCLKWAGYIRPWGDPGESERPVAYVVVLCNKNKAKTFDGRDIGSSVENLILTGLEEGIGCCWMAAIDRRRIRRILGVSAVYTIDSLVALGYPREAPKQEVLKSSVKYWKDKKGVLHVPKRRLQRILHRNKVRIKKSDSNP